MIHEFPQDHELIAFFESEPTVRDWDASWLYNTLEFTTVRNNIEVRCRIVSSYGKITTRLMMGGQELAKFELRDAETIRVIMNERQEVLVATFAPNLRLDNFALQLKPEFGPRGGICTNFPEASCWEWSADVSYGSSLTVATRRQRRSVYLQQRKESTSLGNPATPVPRPFRIQPIPS